MFIQNNLKIISITQKNSKLLSYLKLKIRDTKLVNNTNTTQSSLNSCNHHWGAQLALVADVFWYMTAPWNRIA